MKQPTFGSKALPAAVGFTVKSGWASVVLVTGAAGSAVVSDSRNIELADPRNPRARQPYHAGFGTARDSGPELSALVASVEQFGRSSVADVLRRYQDAGHRLEGVAVVVGSLVDPETIKNAHIRIHALEGRLFRRIVEDGAARNSLTCSTWRERDLYRLAVRTLEQPERSLRKVLTEMRGAVDGPWRAEQKSAALAACLLLRTRD